jgi:hypothetical protein
VKPFAPLDGNIDIRHCPVRTVKPEFGRGYFVTAVNMMASDFPLDSASGADNAGFFV